MLALVSGSCPNTLVVAVRHLSPLCFSPPARVPNAMAELVRRQASRYELHQNNTLLSRPDNWGTPGFSRVSGAYVRCVRQSFDEIAVPGQQDIA